MEVEWPSENLGILPQHYMVSQCRRPKFEYLAPCWNFGSLFAVTRDYILFSATRVYVKYPEYPMIPLHCPLVNPAHVVSQDGHQHLPLVNKLDSMCTWNIRVRSAIDHFACSHRRVMHCGRHRHFTAIYVWNRENYTLKHLKYRYNSWRNTKYMQFFSGKSQGKRPWGKYEAKLGIIFDTSCSNENVLKEGQSVSAGHFHTVYWSTKWGRTFWDRGF